MAEETGERKSRSRRTNIKKNREDIFLYDDIAENEEPADSNEAQQQLKSEEDQQADDDDSFSYNGPKPKRLGESKRGRLKEKVAKVSTKKVQKDNDE